MCATTRTSSCKAGQPLALTVTLEPSPDTGFELTSDPPGGLVWLDGAPVKERVRPAGAHRLPRLAHRPGHHVLEIRGENRFKPWQQDVEIEPGEIRKIHATLIPAVGGPARRQQAAPVATATAPPTAGARRRRGIATRRRHRRRRRRRRRRSRRSRRRSGASPAGGSAAIAAGAGTAAAAGGASAPTTPTPRARDAATGDDTGGEAAATSAAPRKSAVAADDARGRGGDCSITINSIPWSEVWIDGKNTTKHTPFVDFKVPCGKHKLAFKRPDMQIDQTESINVKPGQNFKQRYTLATED